MTKSNAASKVRQLFEDKLKSSGLNLTDAKKLGMSGLSGTETAKLHKSFRPYTSLKIDYLGPDGEPMEDWPGSDPFYRIRYLDMVDAKGFDAMVEKKALKYVQQPNTVPVAYYPQNFGGWVDLCMNPEEPLIITEGELKSAKACKEGFPTLGIGGVYNWRSNKLGIEWLPSLDDITWLRRNVYLCFDSDYKTNPRVCRALKNFAESLQEKGAFTYLVNLPELASVEKVGLDDFLLHAGPSANEMFEELLATAEPLGLSRPLWSMNEKYVYVRNPGMLVDLRDMSTKISPTAFTNHVESTAKYQERAIKPDGNLSFKAVSASMAWLKWPLRLEAAKLTYEPGSDHFIGDGPLLNTWPGWGVEPKKGTVAPFKKLIDHIFTGSEPEAKQWFLQWCAYPIQNPGVKMFSSAVVHGIKHGSGKSLIGYTLGKIYGKNFKEIKQKDLSSDYTAWAENKQFVMGDEITGSDKRQHADELKNLITQQEIDINIKFVPHYTIPDRINYMFTANHPDAFFLEDGDRRFFVHEVLVEPLPDEFYYDYDQWLKKDNGAAALFQYMLDMDLTGFNPSAKAFKTKAKSRMIDAGRSDLASWVRRLQETPDQVLVVGDMKPEQDLFTSKELLMFYDPEERSRTTANGLGRELSRAGIRQVCDGNPIRLASGSQYRYYAVRNINKWVGCTPSQVAKHLDSLTLGKKGKKY